MKYMISTKKENDVDNVWNLMAHKYRFEMVNSFVYLRSTIKNKNNVKEDVTRRIMLGNQCYFLCIEIDTKQILNTTCYNVGSRNVVPNHKIRAAPVIVRK